MLWVLICQMQVKWGPFVMVGSPFLTPININWFLPLLFSWFQHLLFSKLLPLSLHFGNLKLLCGYLLFCLLLFLSPPQNCMQIVRLIYSSWSFNTITQICSDELDFSELSSPFNLAMCHLKLDCLCRTLPFGFNNFTSC